MTATPEHRPETVTLTWEDYVALEDAAVLNADRVRMIRHAVRWHRKNRDRIGWNPWTLRKIVKAVLWALSDNSEVGPETPLP